MRVSVASGLAGKRQNTAPAALAPAAKQSRIADTVAPPSDPLLWPALALALLRRRAREAASASAPDVGVASELAYLRERAHTLQPSSPNQESSTAVLLRPAARLVPPEADAIVAWLEQQATRSAAPADAALSGLALLQDLCLPSASAGDARCLFDSRRCNAVVSLMQKVLALEQQHVQQQQRRQQQQLPPPRSEQPTLLPSVGFMQRLCDAALTPSEATASASWLGMAQRLLTAVALARGGVALGVLAHATVTIVRAEPARRDSLFVLGAQPILGAFQAALEANASSGAAPAARDDEHEGTWRVLLQQAFDDSLRVESSCPLLARCVWHLSLLSVGAGAGGEEPRARALAHLIA